MLYVREAPKKGFRLSERLLVSRKHSARLRGRIARYVVVRQGDLDWNGSTFAASRFAEITAVNAPDWQAELDLHSELVNKLGERLPAAVKGRFESLKGQLGQG